MSVTVRTSDSVNKSEDKLNGGRKWPEDEAHAAQPVLMVNG